MSYTNFVPNLWSGDINRALKRDCVFADGTWNKIRGKISKAGESVTFVGVGRPTIYEIEKADRNNPINAAEEVNDSSVIMPINRMAYFNYKIGDIDKAQALGSILPALGEEANLGLVNTVDSYIAKLAAAADARYLNKNGNQIDNTNVMEALDEAVEQLYRADVSRGTYIEAILTPWLYMALKQQYQKLDTDNSEILTNGKVGKYGSIMIKMSNNVYNDGTDDYIQVRTGKAIGYAKPITHTEAYRPDNGFADAIKGFILYDAKIIRPNEMVVIKAHK